jgi:hypothetical protein
VRGSGGARGGWSEARAGGTTGDGRGAEGLEGSVSNP